MPEIWTITKVQYDTTHPRFGFKNSEGTETTVALSMELISTLLMRVFGDEDTQSYLDLKNQIVDLEGYPELKMLIIATLN